MKSICPQSAYRLLAAIVVLVSVTGFGYLATGHVDTRELSPEVPAFCLAVNALSPYGTSVMPAVQRDQEMFSIDVTVTAYSSTPGQTDSTPYITASNTRVREGIIAVSRDLLLKFTPGAPFLYGDKVEIQGIGTFRVEDTMNSRYTKRVDIWFPNHRTARNWGIQRATLVKLMANNFELAENRIAVPSSGNSVE